MLVLILAFALTFVSAELGSMKREIDFRVKERINDTKIRMRAEEIKQSQAKITGKSRETVPFLEIFKYNPSDTRFIGSPIYYLIFDGLTDSDKKQAVTVILADIKTKPKERLTPNQRRIRKAIEEGRVKWETIRI